MNDRQLAAALQRPEIHRQILGNYKGAYALGVTRSQSRPALLLRIENDGPRNVPAEITIEGEVVPIIVHSGFRAPQAQ